MDIVDELVSEVSGATNNIINSSTDCHWRHFQEIDATRHHIDDASGLRTDNWRQSNRKGGGSVYCRFHGTDGGTYTGGI